MPSPANVYQTALSADVLPNGALVTPAAAGRGNNCTTLMKIRMSRNAAGKFMDQKTPQQQSAHFSAAAVKT
jgi:hypothetical protein